MTSPSANANGAARRKVKAQVLAEEDTCHICGHPVDKTLTVTWGKHGKRCPGDGCPGCSPHPMSPVIDELIPRSKGGSPTNRANCRLAHWRCNRKRSNKVEPAPMPPNPFPMTAGIWSNYPWGGPPKPPAQAPS